MRTLETFKTWALGACSLLMLAFAPAVAQDVDLDAQRKEVKAVNPVPGKKLNHRDRVINPTPQQIRFTGKATLNIAKGYALNDAKHSFKKDLDKLQLSDAGAPLVIDYGEDAARKAEVKPLSGAYTLNVGTDGIHIVGYDERGAFYGLQTLRQILAWPEVKERKQIPGLEINDYPTLPNRGVVEGFYGTPWSHQVRLSLIDSYGRFKMNTYLYGPKDDPFHSSPNWRLPYPEAQAKNLKELVEACRRNRVDFVWAIHPGKDIQWNETDYRNLVHKFNLMYDLGVRGFAIFFDDIAGEGTNPMKQVDLLNRLTADFVQAKGDVLPLTVCPTDYSKLWAKPGENGALAIYGKHLHPDIKVFWTGDVVCSDLTHETLQFINSRIKRPAYYWWNYPVTDYVRHILLQAPVYGLNTTLTDKETCGIVSNPMEHGEASKISLYSVADYAWNTSAYNAIDSWERALAEMMPECPEAYRTFAIHSCDTETGYRRDESWNVETFRLADWTEAAAHALEAEFSRMAEAPAMIEAKCANRALVGEIRPWLQELGKLGERGKRAIELARVYRTGKLDADFWQQYQANLMTEEQLKLYKAHRVGTLKMQPFYLQLMEDMAHGSPQQITPLPQQIEMTGGVYKLPAGATYYVKGEDKVLADYMEVSPLKLKPAAKASAAHLLIDVHPRYALGDNSESYQLIVTGKGVKVQASTSAGAFYGLQSLLQMTAHGHVRQLLCCKVTDMPRFGYRGLLFDVSRHFRSKEFLMKQIDAMALLKLNTMHLHLTDGAGWRLEIDKYPCLAQFAAWRPQRTWMDWTAGGKQYCDAGTPGAYGGFYTKADIRELVAYAEARHVTIIPDIEMPGHSEEVLAAYPELSCTGKPYVHGEFCVGKEETFTFLQDVLSEVIDLFPSPYIHIGGDEAGKEAWRRCPQCQARIKAEGLKDEDELQSYLIHRIETFINGKGRKMIGFDEILEGGLAPNATVMSWRGTAGGIKALKAGHDVVMTPVNYCYLDYTQDASFKEPSSIGGYTPLKVVYDYEPVEAGLTPEDVSHLLGVQANLWTEYVTEDTHAEYMYYPRAFALAETGWTQSDRKDYADFHRRALNLCTMLQKCGYHTFDLAHEYGERRESLQPVQHLARGCKVNYNQKPYHSQYKAAGDATLTDGWQGGWTYRDQRWQGTLTDFDVTIDLGKVQPVHYVGAHFMHSPGAWVHLPPHVTYSISTDGVNFTPAGTVWGDVSDAYDKIMMKPYGVTLQGEARYIRMQAQRHPREGAWLFVDEIVVN